MADNREERKLDDAARAAWSYYFGNRTQEQIAEEMKLSRQAIQRLISLAASEGLIHFRLDHPVARCVDLAEGLRSKFGLLHCEVCMTIPSQDRPYSSLAVQAAGYLESFLASAGSGVIAFGTGRTLRAMVHEVTPMNQPDKKLISAVGNVSFDGRASHFEVVMQLADRINAQAYLLPTPVLTQTAKERSLLQKLRSFRAIRELAREAKAVFVGVAEIGYGCPLHADGFISSADVSALLKRNAVGEIIGWAFDHNGKVIRGSSNDRVAGLHLNNWSADQLIAVSGGPKRVAAIAGGLRGRLFRNLITDELTAQELLRA